MSRLNDLKLAVSPKLTMKVLGFMPGSLVGHRILPLLPCDEQGVRLPKYTAGLLQVQDDARALRAPAKKAEFDAPTYVDVTLEEHTIDTAIDWREVRAGGVVGIDYRSRAARTSKMRVMLAREKAIADLVTTAGSYASGNSETVSSGAAKWDYKTGGVSAIDIIGAVKAKIEVVRAKIGKDPNAFWCSKKVWRAIEENTKVWDRMKLAPGSTTPLLISQAAFAAAIGVPEIIIADAVYSTDGSTLTDVWGDAAGLRYAEPNPGEVESPTFGFLAAERFSSTGDQDVFGFVSTEITERGKIEIVNYTELYKPWVAMNTAAYLWLDTLT